MALSYLRRLVEAGVTPDMSITNTKHVRFANISALLLAAMVLPWVPANLYSGSASTGIELLAIGSAPLLTLLLNRFGWHSAAVFLLLTVLNAQLVFAVLGFGAKSGLPLYFLLSLVLPFLVFPTHHQRWANAMALFAGAMLIIFTVFEERFPAQRGSLSDEVSGALSLSVVALGLLVMAAVFRGLVDATEHRLQEEQARADTLLLNVLPPTIAERLKHRPEEAIADRYDSVTVLFADIVGFTPLSGRLSAHQTVELLNQIFTTFDAICDRIGVEKIRTIGDGYMAVAGAPFARSDHAEAMVKVALEMRDYMASNPVSEPLRIRIGINSGAAVAGIVGTARFHFDIWGDAVNVAARMESLGEPGRIHIAEGTWRLIHNKFQCESRGLMPVKGKGEMETWFVV